MVEHNVENLDNIFRALFDLIISEIVRLMLLMMEEH